MLTAWSKSTKVAALGAVIVVIIAGLLLLRPAVPANQTAPLNSAAQRYTQFVPLIGSARVVVATNPRSAVVAKARGLVELQTDGGQWVPISTGQTLSAGQHLRTQNLSSAALLFYDGSLAQLGPATEVAIEELNAQATGPRTILLAQLSGNTDHQVASSSDPASRYEVHTPNGTSRAKGTRFHVAISPALVTRVEVEEGIVVVINVNVTVQVTAGQVTTIGPGAPPTLPAFQITGEGIITQMDEVWRIGGLDFHTTDTTVIIGNPQLGDRVAVDGHLAPDGTRVADVIVLLSRASQNRFEFTGQVEAIGTDQWTVAGRTVAVSQTTQIEAGIAVGDLVKVEGVIKPDGTWLADSIRLMSETGLPFEFTGVVQQIGAANWTISGITIAVTETTEIEAGLQVGNLVKVEGHILPTGTWLADEIKHAPEFENRFEFIGIVQNMTPWTVSGVTFTTTQQTEIDAGIEIGDRVKVEGRLLPDGTWQAEEIRLLDEQPLTFEFSGQVTSINPWVVSGITFTVNSSTTIESGIEIGDQVRVTGIVQPAGSLLAQRIELVDEELGCTEIRVKVVAINGQQLVLSNGQTIELSDDVEIEGQLQISAVVIIRLCVRADGTVVIVSIIVIFTPLPTLTPVPPPPTGGGKVTICHYPGGDKNKGHTLSVGQSAVGAHLAHGDKLGPCDGGR
ncbi:hypothetical protein TFLX_06230 [Thermoflexales bacterium]|nr:hypothetical protein TFLX_06230 [Thermoflexales bacterium]